MENLEQFVYSINRDSKLLENALEESSYDKMVFSYSEDLKYEITCAIKKYSEILNEVESANGRKEVDGLLKKAAKLKSKFEIVC